MKSAVMPELVIGDIVVKKPVIQGGMGIGVSLSRLASAVADEGGIGVISSVGMSFLSPDKYKRNSEGNMKALRDEIRKARAMTKGVLGLNIMFAITEFDEILVAAFEEGIDVVFMGAGLPLKLPKELTPEMLKTSRTKTAVIVSSDRASKIIFQNWEKYFNHVPDAVVVEGPMAGGHLGFKKENIDNPDFELEKILPGVIEAVKPFEKTFNKKIPVIAAGGIFTGEDIHRFMDMGAAGVQMATRFVATDECDASDDFKKSYIDSKKEDIVIIKSPVGLPGRAIRNDFLDGVEAGKKKPFSCPWKCLKTCNFRESPYCIAQALVNAQKGKLADGFAFAGANAWKIKEIISVKKLFKLLEEEYMHYSPA